MIIGYLLVLGWLYENYFVEIVFVEFEGLYSVVNT